MDILIFGGTRYFGRHVVERLLARGDRVTVFSRGNARPEWWAQVEHIAGDRTDGPGVVARLRGRRFDGVVDNQCFTREQAEAAIQALRGRVGRYVVASTVSIYGEGGHALKVYRRDEAYDPLDRYWVDYRYAEPLREEDGDVAGHPWEYRPSLSQYGEGKRHVERVQLESPPDWPWVVVRVPATLGPDDPSGRFAFWLSRLLDGGPVVLPDGGQHAIQLGYAQDLAAFLVDLMGAPAAARRVYNYAQPEWPRFVHLLEVVARAAGRALDAVCVPTDVLHRHSGLPWADGTYAPFAQNWIAMSIARAQREIGLRPTPLADWVGATVDWYRAHPEGMEKAPHGAARKREVAFAGEWRTAMARLGTLLA